MVFFYFTRDIWQIKYLLCTAMSGVCVVPSFYSKCRVGSKQPSKTGLKFKICLKLGALFKTQNGPSKKTQTLYCLKNIYYKYSDYGLRKMSVISCSSVFALSDILGGHIKSTMKYALHMCAYM